jgi:hypothetical protein
MPFDDRAKAHWRDFKHLTIGNRYQVVKTFTDFDRGEHPVGETWRFEGHSFLPYDDGLSLFVSPDEDTLRHIRMRWTPEDQGEIIDALEAYIHSAA